MWRVVYYWLTAAALYSMFGSIALLPFLIPRRLRGLVSAILHPLTLVWGTKIWISCFIYLLSNHLIFPLVFGCLLFGIGVVPVTIVTAFLRNDIHDALLILASATALLTIRAMALLAAQSAAELENRRSCEERFEAMMAAEDSQTDAD